MISLIFFSGAITVGFLIALVCYSGLDSGKKDE